MKGAHYEPGGDEHARVLHELQRGGHMVRIARIGRKLERALCRLGSHYDLPVAVNRREWYVLLRCERCGRDAFLMGQPAEEWIARFMAGDQP